MQYYKNEISLIKNTKSPIVLFGAMLMGKMARKAINALGKDAVCYCDNCVGEIEWDDMNSRDTVDGLKVLKPEAVQKQYPNAIVVISVFSKKSEFEITKQMESLGFKDILNSDFIRYIYQTKVLDRGITAEDMPFFIQAIDDYSKKGREELYFADMGLIVTEYCNLRCKNCGLQIPYIKNPRHYDADKSIVGIKNFAKNIRGIGTLSLSGGEPLMHPQILDIVREVAKIPNVLQINIITNGAWVPKDEILRELSKYVSRIQIADYGDASAKKKELAEACDRVGLMHEHKLETLSKWCDTGDYSCKNRTEQEMTDLFGKCEFHVHTIVCEGNLYICARIPLGLSREGFNIKDNDYVDLINLPENNQDAKNYIKKYLFETKYINCCNHCNGTLGREVIAGEQIQ